MRGTFTVTDIEPNLEGDPEKPDKSESTQTLPSKAGDSKRYFSPVPRIFRHWTDFSENTTIHGFKYLVEKQGSLAEKLWWLIGMLICVGMLGYFVFAILRKWDESPVVMGIEDQPTSIYKIPFPAVTICPESKINMTVFDYDRAENFLEFNLLKDILSNMTKDELFYYETMAHVCEFEKFSHTPKELWEGHEFMGAEYVRAIKYLSLHFNKTIVYTSYDSNPIKINRALTEDGHCYALNLLSEIFRKEELHDDYQYLTETAPIKNWNSDDGYLNGEINGTYPRRMIAAQKRHSFEIVMKTKKRDITYACRGSEQGYKITLNSPAVYPQPYKDFIQVPHGKDVSLIIKPHLVKASKVLKSYSPEHRQCFYNSERHLRFYNFYNEYNCKAECIANRTLKECGCVKYSLPRGKDVPICGSQKITCYAPIWNEAENNILNLEFHERYFGDRAKIKHLDECNCLPECVKLDYNADVDRQSFDYKLWARSSGIDRSQPYDDDYHYTRIRIYFGSTKFYAYKRSELYGISDLISNFGGLLGLFMGGSILSLVEILYFCTFKILCKKSRNS